MLPLLLSCMIGAGGRSNMLGSCAADHPKRRVLVAASASAPTQAAALDLVLGSADPHSPLRSSAADRPNRRDARRRRCIGSASIKAAALACTTTIALVTGWLPAMAHHPHHECIMITLWLLIERLPKGGPRFARLLRAPPAHLW